MSENLVTTFSGLQQHDWPGFDHVFFDCDSTLSGIEGIDELARKKGKFDTVKALTDAAMEGEVHLQSVYDRRLDLLAPTRAEIRALEQEYRRSLVPDARQVIQALQAVGRELYIVSGGLQAAVQPFGEWLGIPGPKYLGSGRSVQSSFRPVVGLPARPLGATTGRRVS